MTVADSLEELTPAFLTDALQRAGHALTIAGVRGERIGTGQMGTTYRLTLGYEGEPGPATLVAKLAGGDPSMRSLIAQGYAAEVGFYRELAAGLRVSTPRCWHGAIAGDRTCFTLLLDDVAGAVPGVQAEGCTVEQARAALANLVGLHAPRWNDPTLHELPFLVRADEESAAMLGAILPTATEGFVDRYRDDLTAGEVETLLAVAAVIGRWQLAGGSPFSVLHGDYRLDNLLFGPGDGALVAVDWQTASIGPPLRDVAYFLGTSLDVELRRAHEQELVAGYHAALLAAGVSGYDAGSCWDGYRLGHLQGPMITILGCMYAAGERTASSDAMFLAMARRSAAAIRDLDSLTLL